MRWGFWRRPRVDLAPGLAIVPKQTRSDTTLVWVGVCADPGETSAPNQVDIDITIRGEDEADPPDQVRVERARLGRYEYVGGHDLEFFHGHHLISGLDPHTAYTAHARLAEDATVTGGRVTLSSSCRFATLPDQLGDEPLRLVLASCFDIGTDTDRQLPALCAELFADEFPDMTLLIGDQVYLDAPWWQFRSRTKHDPRQFYLAKYWSAWGHGIDGHGGLSPLLRVGGNWFLPDDHEFWNNFPHATPLALHSFKNWRHIFSDRLHRLRQWRQANGEIPESLVEPPSPSEWGTWSRAAYELFASFQTPPEPISHTAAGDGAPQNGPPQPATTVPISAGAADPDQDAAPPLGAICQHVDIDAVRIILVDTRTRRSRSARHPRSGFITADDLDTLIDLVADGNPELVILALAQPGFIPPTNYDGLRNQIRAYTDFDRGMENYESMYRDFWKRMIDARNDRPIIFVGGDVHYNEVAVAPSLVAAQIISSPMSLVEGLTDLKRIRAAISRTSDERPDFDTERLHPDHPGEINWITPYKHNTTEGLTTLDLTRNNDNGDNCYRLVIEHHPRQLTKPVTRTELTIDPHAADTTTRISVATTP